MCTNWHIIVNPLKTFQPSRGWGVERWWGSEISLGLRRLKALVYTLANLREFLWRGFSKKGSGDGVWAAAALRKATSRP